VLGQKDVTSQYGSALSTERYVIEPFAMLDSFTDDLASVIIAFCFIYAIIRILFAFLEKRVLKGRLKNEIVIEHARNIVNFFLKYAGLGACVVLAILGIGCLAYGYLFLNNMFMGLILILSWCCIGMIGIKVVYNLATLFIPRFKFRITNSLPRYVQNKKKDAIVREVCYAGSIVLMLVVGSYALSSIPMPNQRFVPALGPKEYLFDFHVHTYYSDGSLSPQERVDWYIKQGINGAAFTDHENQRGYTLAKLYVDENNLNFTVIQAQEYTRSDIQIHLNIFGVSDVYASEVYANPNVPYIHFMNVSDMIHDVHAKGGFVLVNHYLDSDPQPYTLDQLLSWGVDGFEILNEIRYQGDEIRDFCLAHNNSCAAIGGSDCHSNYDLMTFVKIKVSDPSNLTQLFTELKKNTHQVVRVSYSNEIIGIPNRYLSTIPRVFNYFVSMDTGQRVSWLIWSGVAFVIFAFIKNKIQNMSLDEMGCKIVLKKGKAFDLFKRKR
jgi:hypothetical protein